MTKNWPEQFQKAKHTRLKSQIRKRIEKKHPCLQPWVVLGFGLHIRVKQSVELWLCSGGLLEAEDAKLQPWETLRAIFFVCSVSMNSIPAPPHHCHYFLWDLTGAGSKFIEEWQNVRNKELWRGQTLTSSNSQMYDRGKSPERHADLLRCKVGSELRFKPSGFPPDPVS